MTAETQPLFSPQPEPTRRSGLSDERDADSVLFNLSTVSPPAKDAPARGAPAEGAAMPPPPAPGKESSGLVDIHAMLAQAQPNPGPSEVQERESSGLVNVQALIDNAEREGEGEGEGPEGGVGPSVAGSPPLSAAPLNLAASPLMQPRSEPPLPATPEASAARAPAPAVPRVLLLAVIATLLAVVGLLAWKLLQ